MAGIFGMMAITAVAGSSSSTGSKKERIQLVPRKNADLVKCQTIKKQVDCNTCEYNKCESSARVWIDDVMRCTARDCSALAEPEIDEEEIEESAFN